MYPVKNYKIIKIEGDPIEIKFLRYLEILKKKSPKRYNDCERNIWKLIYILPDIEKERKNSNHDFVSHSRSISIVYIVY